MPNTKQAAKRLRQTAKRRMHNRIQKKVIKTYSKRIFKNLEAGDLEQAEADFRTTIKKMDKAVARGVLHRNTINRRKSRLTIQYREAVEKLNQKG